MCHHLPVSLSAEDKRAVSRLSGVLIPAYAAVTLAVIAALAVAHTPRSNESVASVSMPQTSR